MTTKNEKLKEFLHNYSLFQKQQKSEPVTPVITDEAELFKQLIANNPDARRRYECLLNFWSMSPYAQRIVTLEFKEFPSYQEDDELQLLYGYATRPFAARIAELTHKTDKSDQECYELALLNTPVDRPYAARIAALAYKPERTRREEMEYHLLRYRNMRPVKEHMLDLFDRNGFYWTPEENREVQLLNRYTQAYTQQMVDLENLDKLDTDEQHFLGKLYLKKICRILSLSIDDLSLNFHSVSYNPTYNCAVQSYFGIGPENERARFVAMEQVILFAAQKLAQHFATSLVNQTIEKNSREAVLQNEHMQGVIEEAKGVIALALLKHFYDKAPDRPEPGQIEYFSADKLNLIVQDAIDYIDNPAAVLNIHRHVALEPLLLRAHAKGEEARQQQTAAQQVDLQKYRSDRLQREQERLAQEREDLAQQTGTDAYRRRM